MNFAYTTTSVQTARIWDWVRYHCTKICIFGSSMEYIYSALRMMHIWISSTGKFLDCVQNSADSMFVYWVRIYWILALGSRDVRDDLLAYRCCISNKFQSGTDIFNYFIGNCSVKLYIVNPTLFNGLITYFSNHKMPSLICEAVLDCR